MIFAKEPTLSPAQLAEVTEIAAAFGCRIQEIVGEHRSIYAILGDERHDLMFNRLAGLPYVDRVRKVDSSFKLLDRHSELSEHPIVVGEVTLGQQPLFIAGPCTVDPKNPSLLYETAQAIMEAGAHALRGGVWKPRTTPYSFQGDSKSLDIMLEAKARTGLPLNIEVMDEENLQVAVKSGVDILQVGTRNAQNYSLLRKIGEATAGTNTLVLLKRGRHMGGIDEFISAAEYVAAAGNPRVALCPRGTMPALDGYRNHPDESITPLLQEKTWAPVIWDASHAVGLARYVAKSTLAGFAYGADGCNLECHIHPSKGLGDDPKQAITPAVLQKLIIDAKVIWNQVRKYEDGNLVTSVQKDTRG